ncbi:radical SAM protein [Pontiellaceae bacterium B1224]|nr:radical SAM protein [Pontiellaceae bacterium B1224]
MKLKGSLTKSNQGNTVKKYNYLFGPVPSRRFGRSLGVDLTPYKTCSFDCVFCQLGRTTVKTTKRKEYIPVHEVIEELGDWLESSGEADYISLAGSGEPTLHSRFGEVIEFVRNTSDIPVVLLTNGSLLKYADVRAAASKANIVKVSLSAGNQALFETINRPAANIALDILVEGLQHFRKEFAGELWLEVFVIWGINSTPKDLSRISELAATFKPDRIQLNTAVRPPAEGFVHPVPKEQLEQFVDVFTPNAEIIAEFSSNAIPSATANEDTILAMLQRRPCTATEISDVLGLHINEVSKYVGKLERTNQIHAAAGESTPYYTAP